MSMHREPDAARPRGVSKNKLIGLLTLAAGLFALVFGVAYGAADVPIGTAVGLALALVWLTGDVKFSLQAVDTHGSRAVEVGLLAARLMRAKDYDTRKAIKRAALCYILPACIALAALARWLPGYDLWCAMTLCVVAGQNSSGVVYALAAIDRAVRPMAKSFARKVTWKNPPEWALWLVALLAIGGSLYFGGAL